MKISFSWDDGALEDQKLFELHERYRIPGMFFVPTRNQEGRSVLTPTMIREAESKYISFGGHTENHIYLTNITLPEVRQEILLNKIYLEDILDHKVDDFCLPGGQYTPEVLNIAYEFYKTVRTADTMCFKYKGGVFKPTFHLYPRGKKSLLWNGIKNKSLSQTAYVALHINATYFELIRNLIKKEKEKNSVVMIWGHSWELEQYDLWEDLKEIMQLAAKMGKCCSYSEMFEE